METVLGLDGGGTKTEIALVDRKGRVVRFVAGPGLDPMSGEDWAARLQAMAAGLGPVDRRRSGPALFQRGCQDFRATTRGCAQAFRP